MIIRNYTLVIALTLIQLTGLTGLANAATVDLFTTFDGRIIDNGADGFDTLDESVLLANYVDNNIIRVISRAAMEFDLNALPAGTPTDRVIFEINQVSHTAGIMNAEFYAYTGNGIFDLSDALQIFTPIGTPTHLNLNGPLFIDVTTFINGLIDSGEQWAGFTIKMEHEERFLNSDGFFINAYMTQWADPDGGAINPPVLHFMSSPVPLPPAVILFGSGLIGLFSFARKLKQKHY